jgi:hypothetical protein
MTTAVSHALQPAAAAKARNIIAVASGKGGVGKTWLAITLAHALARLGRRTLLFDGDLGLANVDIQLGLMPEHDLGGVLAGRLSLSQATLPFAPGFDIVAGRSGCGRLAGVPAAHLTRLCDDLVATAARYDHIILDLGAGLERMVRELTAPGRHLRRRHHRRAHVPHGRVRVRQDRAPRTHRGGHAHRRQHGEFGTRRRTDLRRTVPRLRVLPQHRAAAAGRGPARSQGARSHPQPDRPAHPAGPGLPHQN